MDSALTSSVVSSPTDIPSLLAQGNNIAQQNQMVLIVCLVAVGLILGLEIARAFSFWKW